MFTLKCGKNTDKPKNKDHSQFHHSLNNAIPSPADFSNLGIEPWSPALQEDSLLSEPPGKPNKYILVLIIPDFLTYNINVHTHLFFVKEKDHTKYTAL